MGEPAKQKRIPKRANKCILTNQFRKSIGTIFAGQYAIGLLGGVSADESGLSKLSEERIATSSSSFGFGLITLGLYELLH